VNVELVEFGNNKSGNHCFDETYINRITHMHTNIILTAISRLT